MNKNELKRRIFSVLLILYLVVVIFFPKDQYNLKIIILFIVCSLSIKDIFRMKSNFDYITFLISLIFPIITIGISTFITGSFVLALKAGYVPLLFLWFPIIIYNNLRIKEYFFLILKIEAIIIVAIVGLDTIGIINVNTGLIREFIYKWEMGYMGKSVQYALYYKLFFKTSPLLIFLVDEMFETKKYPMLIIACLALVFSGTRANFIAMIVYLIWNVIFYHKKKNILKIVSAILILCLIVINLSNITGIFYGMMSTKGSISSDNIRKGQLRSYKEIFSDFRNFFIGTGLGSSFYNYGRSKMVSSAEYAYLDLIRQVGVMFFLIFMIFVLYPLTRNIALNRKVIYIGYLAIAFTNPLLFSSTAFLAYIYMYYLVYESYKEKLKLLQ